MGIDLKLLPGFLNYYLAGFKKLFKFELAIVCNLKMCRLK